mmetsp:Transcript_5268/g.7618  ORF Transcript_5268/g.7618 Transcript_5268/m.7618 type:complete len:361 (-) Transcript_5268:197-1279(-)|eukprot:CAMPEP_0202445242 /NCGR_PEP_ID=MMETSP1360-20130828/4096_1 /ASSEMBLY_ACC=CAM_ASM_000848 /TAXON_ID=515479 /ORGANISM="Licmophora paradoxa, Strain CCMP2313" /LENGTH=360 /DNA_ID=CAMNT_0049061427 /DNA_START=134 /DNA_END=1216 /DNA_ORIENTATION=-
MAGTSVESSRKNRRERRKKKSHRVQPAETSCKDKTQLSVDTRPTNTASVPRQKTPHGVRGSRDLRSPGANKTPTNTPDFITQTDRFGNATTPRSQASIQKANDDKPNKQQEDDVDPCETLLDSIRLMCCCLLPEDEPPLKRPSKGGKPSSQSSVQTDVTDDEEFAKLLPSIHPEDNGKKCLVLDLDETLVHSSFRSVPGADFVIPVQIEDVVHFVYVAKRPGVDEFLIEMAKHYEIIVYTASLNKYADPLLDLLDPKRVIRTRLFRESCVYYEGSYVKDLSLLNRDLSQCIIVDNSPNSYIFHPDNAIDCSSFIDDPADRELDQIGAFLKGIKGIEDVRGVAPQWRDWPDLNREQPEENR